MASKTPVGFIGLGNMGNPMAKNLMKHGYPLILYDVFPDACKEFQEAGEQVASSPADVAEKADRIITMLPTSMNSIEVYSGANGILKKVKKGSLLIDSSTIDPSVSKELAKEVEKMGAVFMDAPVSGGPNQEQKEREHEQGTQDREGCTYTLRQWGCSTGHSPRPAGLGLKKHGIKPDSLNIADNEDY
ncbi:3-hydroxyisobutyrate dehydrogenase, mitochondrial [Microtus ochrogaster]|uniref:3-hydroxyisobutyrate dehydrogenase n=1 Tax=Microtus ochrogaster TaxID=79684 RepID=A0A8J6GEY9_MICOH|nr:3-hydroxyisobutyrate dehydrogenase, mitochondrial [Microtus ochrogaster]